MRDAYAKQEAKDAVSDVTVEGSVLAACIAISQEMVNEMCDTQDERDLVHAEAVMR